MFGKKSKPVIEILTGSLVSGYRDFAASSPRSRMESKTQSPRGLRTFDFGGVGLGIVAALERSGGDRNDIPGLFSRNMARSDPIPVNSQNNSWMINRRSSDVREAGNLEYTKVYSDGVAGGRKGDGRSLFRIQNSIKSNRASVFHISPAIYDEATGIPAPDFLSSCNLCQKKLHGKDIYMYRGERAFCSTECRYRQVLMDERKEKCSSEAPRPAAEAAGSPHANAQIFTTVILAI